MGKRMLRGWQGLKAGRGVGSGRWGGWTGRRGDGEGWMATEGWRQGGGIWKGAMGRGAIGTGRGWQCGGGQGEEEMERGAMGKGGKMGRGQRGGGKGKEMGMGRGRRKGKRRGDFTDGYNGMPGWTQAIGFINSCKQIECLG